MYIGIHAKYPLFLRDFNETSIFVRFSKFTEISNFMKIHPAGAEFLHADRWTDRDTQIGIKKLRITFHNFATHLKIMLMK